MPNNEQKEFTPKDLLTPEIKIGNGQTVPLFFATCQTAINNTSWRGSDLDNIKLVKSQLLLLLKFCQNLPQGEALAPDMNNLPAEQGVAIGEGIAPATNENKPTPEVVEEVKTVPIETPIEEKKK